MSGISFGGKAECLSMKFPHWGITLELSRPVAGRRLERIVRHQAQVLRLACRSALPVASDEALEHP